MSARTPIPSNRRVSGRVALLSLLFAFAIFTAAHAHAAEATVMAGGKGGVSMPSHAFKANSSAPDGTPVKPCALDAWGRPAICVPTEEIENDTAHATNSKILIWKCGLCYTTDYQIVGKLDDWAKASMPDGEDDALFLNHATCDRKHHKVTWHFMSGK